MRLEGKGNIADFLVQRFCVHPLHQTLLQGFKLGIDYYLDLGLSRNDIRHINIVGVQRDLLPKVVVRWDYNLRLVKARDLFVIEPDTLFCLYRCVL